MLSLVGEIDEQLKQMEARLNGKMAEQEASFILRLEEVGGADRSVLGSASGRTNMFHMRNRSKSPKGKTKQPIKKT